MLISNTLHLPEQYSQNFWQNLVAASVLRAHIFCVSFSFLQSTSGESIQPLDDVVVTCGEPDPPLDGVHKPQNFGQYNKVGGESFLAHKCNVSFICLQSKSPLSTHVSIVVPVGGGSVDPSARKRLSTTIKIYRPTVRLLAIKTFWQVKCPYINGCLYI
jgi:hypothetical protein